MYLKRKTRHDDIKETKSARQGIIRLFMTTWKPSAWYHGDTVCHLKEWNKNITRSGADAGILGYIQTLISGQLLLSTERQVGEWLSGAGPFYS